MWIQRCDEHQARVQFLLYVLCIWNEACHAVLRECGTGVTQQPYGPHSIAEHDRLEDVQLKVTITASDGYRDMMAHHLAAHCGHHLAYRRIDLAWHNGAPRLIGRKNQLPETTSGSTSEEPNVIGDLCTVHTQEMLVEHKVVGKILKNVHWI